MTQSNLIQITHHRDPVVHLPPEDLGFFHVETEVALRGCGKESDISAHVLTFCGG